MPAPDADALPILYRDDDLVAIDKPAGLLVHRSPIDRRETRFALQLLRDQIGQRVYPAHRLDKPTSGALVFGLSPGAAAHLSEQFRERAVGKRYLAVLRGYCPDAGIVDHPIRDDPDPLLGLERGPAREARSGYRCLARAELPCAVDRYPTARYSLARLTPETGRKHQLRRHMKHLGHPIIGDAKHGKGVHNRFFRERFNAPRLLLACTELTLHHPRSGHPLALRAGLDPTYLRVIEALGWSAALDAELPWLNTQRPGP